MTRLTEWRDATNLRLELRELAGGAIAEIARLRFENSEMRRTFGSHPLFEEKAAEIARLRSALQEIVDNSWGDSRDHVVVAKRALEQGGNDANS